MKQSEPKTLDALAALIGARIQGDPSCLIDGIAPLESAKPGDLSFVTHKQYRKYLATSQASAVIVGSEDAKDCPIPALISDNPRLSLAKAAKLFEKNPMPAKGIHATAVVGQGCEISASASIGAYSVIGDNVQIGENVIMGSHCSIGHDCSLGSQTVLKPHVTLYDNVRVGAHCLIHSGAVVGSDGFGFANQGGTWVKMPHLGGVVVGDQVEIGANTTIDRGFLEDTIIGQNVIIDNLVQVGHNVVIGARTAIAGCVAIAGSAIIGEGCLIGGGSSIAGHLKIAAGVHITATSGVNHSISTPGIYSSGFPAKPAAIWRKNAARFQFLDNMAKRLRVLENIMRSRLQEDE